MPGYKICYHMVHEYRDLNQTVSREPIDDFPGHANVRDRRGKRSAGTKSKLALSAKWVDL